MLSLTAVAGPLIGTTVFSYFTGPEQSLKLPGAAFFLGSALTCLGLILAVRTFVRYPAAVHAGQVGNLSEIGARVGKNE